jgi:hypothetical protein
VWVPKDVEPEPLPERIRGHKEALGGGAHIRLDLPQPSDESGLRVSARDNGDSDLLCDDPIDGA